MIWSSALPSPPIPREGLLKRIRPIWEKMLAEPRKAGPTLSSALRADRALGGRDRPLAGDILLGFIRHQRALSRIDPDCFAAWVKLAEQGPPDLPDPENALAIALSLPDWLAHEWQARLGEQALTLPRLLAGRSPIALRQLCSEIPQNAWMIGNEPVTTRQVGPKSILLEGRCNLQLLPAYANGLVEVQDLGSQGIVDACEIVPGMRVFDMCAGAGGKSLALAALGARVQAWDIRPQALDELHKRAGRCGLRVRIQEPGPEDRFDLVLVDAPCSGTGVLRRHPENRWKLQFPTDTQKTLLQRALALAPRVIYATCALTDQENGQLVRQLASPTREQTLWPTQDADGFYWAELRA